MKTYHIKTQESYNCLMTELESKGYAWGDGYFPTSDNKFPHYKEQTAIMIYHDSKAIKYSNINDVELYTRDKIVEYKVEKVASIECKQCHNKRHHDNAKYCSTCGNRLVDEPEFKFGEIVASRIFRDASFSLVLLNEDLTNRITSVDGFWYTKDDYAIGDMSLEVFKEDTRHATPEEIAEYEVALTFHNHGRKPFEVKEGDILLEDGHYKFFVDDPENWGKEDFVSGEYTFAKTVEEVNEWIKGE